MKYLFSLLFLLTSFVSFSQTAEITVTHEKNLYGFSYLKNRVYYEIPPVFKRASHSGEVTLWDGSAGFISFSPNEATFIGEIPPVEDASQALFCLSIGVVPKNWTVIDIKNQEVDIKKIVILDYFNIAGQVYATIKYKGGQSKLFSNFSKYKFYLYE